MVGREREEGRESLSLKESAAVRLVLLAPPQSETGRASIQGRSRRCPSTMYRVGRLVSRNVMLKVGAEKFIGKRTLTTTHQLPNLALLSPCRLSSYSSFLSYKNILVVTCAVDKNAFDACCRLSVSVVVIMGQRSGIFVRGRKRCVKFRFEACRLLLQSLFL